MKSLLLSLLAALALALPSQAVPPSPPPVLQHAVFGMGCFWCSQALFEKFRGVDHITCGYAGGATANPSYEDVCTGTTGHAEVVDIAFDPAQITYSQLLDIFWDVHDPTTLNRQGNDEGTQYRSVILYENDGQKKEAEASLQAAQKKSATPLVTQIVPLKAFYPAEDYHQEYYQKHPDAPYCLFVISPKFHKLEKHADLLKAKP